MSVLFSLAVRKRAEEVTGAKAQKEDCKGTSEIAGDLTVKTPELGWLRGRRYPPHTAGRGKVDSSSPRKGAQSQARMNESIES